MREVVGDVKFADHLSSLRHVARARTTRRTWVRVAAHSNVNVHEQSSRRGRVRCVTLVTSGVNSAHVLTASKCSMAAGLVRMGMPSWFMITTLRMPLWAISLLMVSSISDDMAPRSKRLWTQRAMGAGVVRLRAARASTGRKRGARAGDGREAHRSDCCSFVRKGCAKHELCELQRLIFR